MHALPSADTDDAESDEGACVQESDNITIEHAMILIMLNCSIKAAERSTYPRAVIYRTSLKVTVTQRVFASGEVGAETMIS